MKKFLFGTAIASLALVGCVSEEPATLPEQARQKITFDAPVMYSNDVTKANVYGEIGELTDNGITYSYPKNEQFMIYAVGHTGDFTGWDNATLAGFNNTAIAYDFDVDGWAPMTDGKYYYWEEGRKMTYAASSPADLEQAHWGDANKRTYGAEGLSILDFEISADPAKQYDLLFSTRTCNQTASSMNHNAGYYSGLPITFQHALSSIRFSVRNTSSESVVLTGIKVSGVKYKGDFNENITENPLNITQYDRTANTGNVAPEWTVKGGFIANPYVGFTGSVSFPAEARYVSQLLADPLAHATGECHQLLLMPQELTDDAVVTVNYTVNGKANEKTVQLKGLKSGAEEPAVGEPDTRPVIDEWEIGKRYTYRLSYSSETADKDKIYFSPSTDLWKDVEVIVVAL